MRLFPLSAVGRHASFMEYSYPKSHDFGPICYKRACSYLHTERGSVYSWSGWSRNLSLQVSRSVYFLYYVYNLGSKSLRETVSLAVDSIPMTKRTTFLYVFSFSIVFRVVLGQSLSGRFLWVIVFFDIIFWVAASHCFFLVFLGGYESLFFTVFFLGGYAKTWALDDYTRKEESCACTL